MKKIWLGTLFFLFFIGKVSASSDIQITSPIVSFFENYNVSGEGVECKGNNIFTYGDSALRITNQNFIGDFNLGFYESVSLVLGSNIYLSNYNAGIQFSIGPVYKIVDIEKMMINCGIGPHFQIYEDGYILGGEIDSQIKFSSNRRCSFIIGAITNFDLYSTRKFYEYVWRTEIQTLSSISSSKFYSEVNSVYTYEEKVEHKVSKYFHFYLKPYISFCVNLY